MFTTTLAPLEVNARAGSVKVIFGPFRLREGLGHKEPVPLFQQLARDNRSDDADVHEVSAVALGGVDVSHETVRFWWNRFGPMFAAEIRKRRAAYMRGFPQRR